MARINPVDDAIKAAKSVTDDASTEAYAGRDDALAIAAVAQARALIAIAISLKYIATILASR